MPTIRPPAPHEKRAPDRHEAAAFETLGQGGRLELSAVARRTADQGTKFAADLSYAGKGRSAMTILKWALIMLVVSLVAALFGFTDLAAASADVARVLFYVFVVIFLVLLVLGLT